MASSETQTSSLTKIASNKAALYASFSLGPIYIAGLIFVESLPSWYYEPWLFIVYCVTFYLLYFVFFRYIKPPKESE